MILRERANVFNDQTVESHLKHITNYYELDATSSGLQIISMLFRDTELATLCNLIGTENNDIYQVAADKFTADRYMLEQFIRLFTSKGKHCWYSRRCSNKKSLYDF